MTECYYCKSPLGIIKFLVDDGCVCSVGFVEAGEYSNSSGAEYKMISSQFEEYFAGRRRQFDLPIKLSGTEFQCKVWNEIKKIPYGQILTYSDISKNLGNPNLCRAVGNACNKNPVPLIIPCHRVVSKNGKVGGYAYGTDVKQKLLNMEISAMGIHK